MIYITLVTPLILAAFVEWFLWLGAFLFGLVNVYRKASLWTTRMIAIFIMILFSVLRYMGPCIADFPSLLIEVIEQIHLPSRNDRHLAPTRQYYASLLMGNGQDFAVVCFLYFLSAAFGAVDPLHLQTCHKRDRSFQEN